MLPEASTLARRLGPFLIGGAGLLGAAGVILMALAAHTAANPSLGTIGTFSLVHAAAIVAVSQAATPSRCLSLGGVALLVGPLLFGLGVGVHTVAGILLGPMAPTGGVVTIGGWLLVAAAGVEILFTRAVPPRA